MCWQGVRAVKYSPPHSPDLNPMEDVWSWMKTQVYTKNARTALQQLKNAVYEKWNQVPEWVCVAIETRLQR